ncbi:MAG TPA: hypothetical protein DCM08_08435, partial [Microscillaceae bacterium]|nr:hypothetical protein [Microscillaceae bacterium]
MGGLSGQTANRFSYPLVVWFRCCKYTQKPAKPHQQKEERLQATAAHLTTPIGQTFLGAKIGEICFGGKQTAATKATQPQA